MSPHRPPVFLDRDGTVIVEKHYLSDPEQVELEAGAAGALRLLYERGHPLIMVSNQSGIGRGLLFAADARRVEERIAGLLQQDGVAIAGWYLCPHRPEDACECRKPLPGMARAAARDLGVQLQGSYVIGDKRSDLEMADAIGATGILVSSGHGEDAAPWALADGRPVFSDLLGAARYVIAAGEPTPSGESS